MTPSFTDEKAGPRGRRALAPGATSAAALSGLFVRKTSLTP